MVLRHVSTDPQAFGSNNDLNCSAVCVLSHPHVRSLHQSAVMCFSRWPSPTRPDPVLSPCSFVGTFRLLTFVHPSRNLSRPLTFYVPINTVRLNSVKALASTFDFCVPIKQFVSIFDFCGSVKALVPTFEFCESSRRSCRLLNFVNRQEARVEF